MNNHFHTSFTLQTCHSSALVCKSTYLRTRVSQQHVQLLVGDIPHPRPPRLLVVVPQPSQTYRHPLTQVGVGIVELLQANAEQGALQGGLLAVVEVRHYAGEDEGRLSPMFRLKKKKKFTKNYAFLVFIYVLTRKRHIN